MTSAAEKGDDEPALPESLPPTVPPTAPGRGEPAAQVGRYVAGAIVAGKYQLVSVLGEGGMGAVWVAKNRTLEVEVALKLMRAELAEEVEGVAERMLQEARAAASIGHPAIIQVFDFGFSEVGDPFIVMELLRGESLAELLRRRGRVPPLRAAQTLLPIVDALAAAHAAGIVHRDIKPENVFLSRLGARRLQPKVLDFGIAKLEQRAQERLTKDGAVIGSPAYMAPEQLRGEPGVDARADIWALCVVLYQMLCGRRPFEGDSYHASMWNVLNTEPRPISEHGVEEPELWAVLKRGLEKDSRARFADMRALGRELASWLAERGVSEDITDASLKAWLAPRAPADNCSFFPSQEPSLRRPEADEAAPAAELVESSGTRAIAVLARTPSANPFVPTATRPRPSRRATEGRRWLWLTLASAVVAFLAAAAFAAVSVDSDLPETEEPSEVRRAPRSRRAPSAPPARQRPRPPTATPLEPSAESAGEGPAPESEPRVTHVAPQRAQTQRAPVRRPSPKSELKNPFGE